MISSFLCPINMQLLSACALHPFFFSIRNGARVVSVLWFPSNGSPAVGRLRTYQSFEAVKIEQCN